jgi:hypothetical protein
MKDETDHSKIPFNYRISQCASGGNITISLNEDEIKIQDNLTGFTTNFSAADFSVLSIETSFGNDVIHIRSNDNLQKPYSVYIYSKGLPKLITGCKNTLVNIQVMHDSEQDLMLPDDNTATYEANVEKIRLWNENSRKADGIFKSIKRKLVYFFGRDLKFKRPFLYWDYIRKIFLTANTAIENRDVTANNYFTNSKHLSELESIAHPCDILLRYQDGYPFDKYFVGTWQHAGLYYRKGKVIDAMGKGTYLRSMEQFCEADGIVLLRISGISAEQEEQALSYAFEQVGKSYSVDFNDNISEQYCSGLIINSLKYAGVLNRDYYKGKTIHPDDLLKIEQSEIIWTNRPDLLKMSLRA